jgi:hypothetical protein
MLDEANLHQVVVPKRLTLQDQAQKGDPQKWGILANLAEHTNSMPKPVGIFAKTHATITRLLD